MNCKRGGKRRGKVLSLSFGKLKMREKKGSKVVIKFWLYSVKSKSKGLGKTLMK